MTDLERALVHLQSAYRVELDALQTEAYKRGLADFRGDVVREAVAKAIQTEKFFPAISVIRDCALEVMAENRRNTQNLIGNGEPPWSMSDESHAELMERMAQTRAKLFGKSMDKS